MRAFNKNMPKRPPTAFFLYRKEVWSQVVDELSDSSFGSVVKQIGQMWKAISKEERAKYEETSNELRQKYKLKKTEYEKTATFLAHQRKMNRFQSKKLKKKK